MIQPLEILALLDVILLISVLLICIYKVWSFALFQFQQVRRPTPDVPRYEVGPVPISERPQSRQRRQRVVQELILEDIDDMESEELDENLYEKTYDGDLDDEDCWSTEPSTIIIPEGRRGMTCAKAYKTCPLADF